MKYEFNYMEREVCVYGLSVNRWHVTVSGSHLMAGDDEKAVWETKGLAVVAAHDFVKSITDDEGSHLLELNPK